MSDPVLKKAYDEACAVFTKPVRFVEWKMYEARGTEPKHLRPFGLTKDRSGAWKEIEGERWIYAFRSYINVQGVAIWWEELHRGPGGDLSATPMDPSRVDPSKRVEPDKRPAGVPIGQRISFPRRVNGHVLTWYFFASRMPLSLKAIDELQKHVQDYVPHQTFEENDPNVIPGHDELLVPVLDPITVAMHLHEYYVAAADDLINYTTTEKHQTQPHQKEVVRRQKKVLLARVLKAVVDGDPANSLVNLLYDRNKNRLDQSAIDNFLKEYDGQINARTSWRDRWCSYLCNWLDAWPMKLVEKEFLAKPKELLKYFVPWCLCITRLSESICGRKLLGKIFDDQAHFFHAYFSPREIEASEVKNVVRKAASAWLEAFKEWPAILVVKLGKVESVEYVVKTMKLHWDIRLKRVQRPIDWARDEGEPGAVFDTKVVKGQHYEILEFEKIEHREKELESEGRWRGAATKVLVVVEAINMAFAIHDLIEAMKGEDIEKQKIALLEFLEFSLDSTSAALSLAKVSERAIGAIGFLSGCIETYIAGHELLESYEKGDNSQAIAGGYLTLTGSAATAAWGLAALLAVPGAQVFLVAGLLLVALGHLLSMFRDNDYETYVKHCCWGELYGEGNFTPEWATRKISDWKHDAESLDDYDEQFRALLNLISKFEIEAGSDPREAELKMGFMPSRASFDLHYIEKWSSAGDSRDLTDKATIEAAGEGKPPAVKASKFEVVPEGERMFKVRPSVSMTTKPLTVEFELPDGPMSEMWNPELNSISLEVRLVMKFGKEKFYVPHSKPASKQLRV